MDWDDDLDCEQIDALEQVALSVQLSAQHADRPPQPLCRPSQTQASQPTLYAPSQNMQTVASSQPPPTSQHPHQACHGAVVERADHPPNIPDSLPPYGGPPRSLHELKHRIQAFKGEVLFLPPPPPPSHTCPGVYGRGCGGAMEWCSFEHLEGVPPFWGCSKYWEEGGRGACSYKYYPPERLDKPRLDMGLIREDVLEVRPFVGAEDAVQACGGVELLLKLAGVDLRRALPVPPAARVAGARNGVLRQAEGGHTEIKGILDAEGMVETRKTDGVYPQAASSRADAYHCQSLNQGKRTTVGSGLGQGSDQQSQEAARPNNFVRPGGVLSPGCSALQHPNAQTCVAMDRDDDVAMVLLTWQPSGGVRFPFAYYKNLTDALQAANHDLGGDCLLPSGKPVMPRGTFAAFTNTRAHRCSAEEVERRYAKLPLYFECALLPFQREGVKFALERKGRCLIADEMGVGKTVQAIAVARCYRDEDWPLLIVCPASLRLVWAEELEKWLPDLDPANVHVIMDKNDALTIKPAACGHDTPAETATAAMEQHCNDAAGNGKSDNSRFLPEVTIISYTMLEHLTCDACKKARKTFTTSTAPNNGRPCGVARSPQRGGTARYSGSCKKPHQCMASMHWGMLIADESHVLRTSTASDEVDAQHTEALRSLTSCPTLRAKRLIFLSGTPSLNKPFDLWNQIAMLRPGLLGSNRKEFGNNYCGRRLLPVAGRYRDTAASGRPGSNSSVFRKRWDCSGLTRASELHLLLRQEIMLRRLKRDVLDQLPAKRRQVIRLPKPPPKDWPKRDGARRHCADDSDVSSSDDADDEDRGHEADVAPTLGAGKEKAAQTEQRGDDLPAAGIGKFGSANAVSGVDQRTDTAVSGDEMLSPAPPELERKMSAQHRTGIAKCRLATEWIMTQLGLDEGDATTLSENATMLDANEAFAECDNVGGVENNASASLSASHTSFCATNGKQRRRLSASNASITPSTVGTQPKFIIFAHHRAVMNHLAAELDRALMVGNSSNSGRGAGGVGVRRRFEFVRVDGETDAEGRREAVERFRSDARVRVALLSVTAAGVGLDFSAASGVVFVELPAEVWLVRQAEDRAHRHGQKQTVNVYFLCARGTCDERHWQRLSSSLAQVGAVHDGPLENKRSDAAVIGNTNSGAPLGIGDARIATKSVTAGQATAAALGEAAGLLVDDVMTLATQVEMPIGCNTSLKMKINTTDNLVIAPPVDDGGGSQKVVATNDGNAPSSPSQVADVNEHGVHGDDGAPLLLLCDPALSTHHHAHHHRVGPVGDTCQGNDAVGGHGKTGQPHLEASAQNLLSLQDRAAKTTPLSVLHHRHHQTHPDTNASAGVDTANAHSPVQTAHLAANATQPCDGDDATGQEHVIDLTCSPLQGQPEGKTVADESLSLLPHGNGNISTDAGLHTKALVLLECDGDASSRGANGIAQRAEYRPLPGTNVGEGSISSHEMITSSSSAAAAVAAVAAAVTGCALGTQRAPESHQSHPRAPSLLHSTFSWWFEVSAHTQRVHFHAAEDRSKPLLLSLPLEALLAPSAPCIPQLIQAVQSQLQPSKLASASAPATQGMPATPPRNDINVVIAGVGPLAIDVSLLCGDIQVLHTAVQAARDFAAEWKELTPARRNRLMNKILQAPLEDAAEAAHQAAVAEGAFGNGTERFRRDGLCGIIDMHHDGCCVDEEANARMLSLTTLPPPPPPPPPGAEWKVVAVHYRKHRRTVLYRQAFRQKQPVVANRNQGTATANGKGTRNEDELAIASNSPDTEQAVNDDSTLMMPTATRTLEATTDDLLCGSEPQTREHQALKAGHDGAEPTWIRLCLQCQKEVPNCEDVPLSDSKMPLNSLWTLFCHAKCERKYALARSGHAGRRAVLRRDRGICADCGLNCTTMVRRLQAIERGTKKWRVRRRELLQSEYFDFVFRAGVKAVDALVERATPGHAWQADHIIPVYAGGGQCDVDNLRTLCTPCHLAVTKAQAKERAAERRAQKLGCVTRNNPGRNTGTTTNNAHNANTKKNDDDIDNDDANAAESVEKKPRRRGKRQREKLKESDEEDGEESIRARKERATTGGRGKDANKKSMHMRRTHRGRGVRVPAHAAEMVAREGVACARDVAGVYDGAVAGLDRTDGPDEKNADMTIDLTKE